MSHTNTADDIQYLKELAESGATAPNISGRFYIWWSSLAVVYLVLHWAIVSGLIPIQQMFIGLVWGSYAIVGFLGSYLLSRTVSGKPGQGSAGNKASGAYWSAVGPGMFIIAISIALGVFLRGAPTTLFNVIPAFALFAYGGIFMVESRLDAVKWKAAASFGCIASAGVMLFLVEDPIGYLATAAAMTCLGIIPGVIMMQNEPAQTV